MDEKLYRHCLTNLEKLGYLAQCPIIVVGNSGSGKSIAVARLAYRIFQERKYPAIFQNRQSNYDEDSRSTCLNEFLKFLEENGAPSVLLIIGRSSVGKTECDKLMSLFLNLCNRGRNLTIVFTAYSIDDNYSSDYNKKTNKNSDKKSNGFKQIDRTIQSVIEQDLKNLLISVAIFSLFKMEFLSNLAYRLMRSLNETNISAIARIHVFHYKDTEEGSYEFNMRMRIEATMLLNYFGITDKTPEMKIERIEKMLNKLHSLGSVE